MLFKSELVVVGLGELGFELELKLLAGEFGVQDGDVGRFGVGCCVGKG